MATRRNILKMGAMLGAGSLLAERFSLSNAAQAATVTNLAPGISSIINDGFVALDFTGTKWKPVLNRPSLTQNYRTSSGLGILPRTPVTSMLRWGPIANPDETIEIRVADFPGQAPLMLNGRFGLWIYVQAQPGYSTGTPGARKSGIHVVMSTDPTGDFSHALDVYFNSNQVREGWNFLKFVDNPIGHPLGVYKNIWGNGSRADIKNNPVYAIQIYADNVSNVGATWYLDSLWTGFKNFPQMVLGCDAVNPELRDYCLPIFNSYGWLGYIASPYRVGSGPTKISNWDITPHPVLTAMANAGWDIINHTVNHLRMGDLTKPEDIIYEIVQQDKWLRAMKMPTKGLRFYASPQSSTSRISEQIIRNCGIVAQRHALKWNTSITQFGIDNPNWIGALGMEDSTHAQTFDRIKNKIDIMVAYEDVFHMYWHQLITQGDPGNGTGNANNSARMYKSSWDLSIKYIRELELQGKLSVAKGFSGFWNF